IVRRLPRDRQTMFFSATMEGAVGGLAARYTRSAARHEVAAARRTVDEAEHQFIPVSEAGKIDALVGLLESEPGRALIFVRTKRGADRLTAKLEARGISVAAMHGDLSQSARERTLKRFRAGTISTLIATHVAARGVDVQD